MSDEDFVLLYRQQRSALVWHVRSHGASEAEACDAVQEAFASALRARDRIRDPGAWPAWLRTVAVRWYLRSLHGSGGRAGGGGRSPVEVVLVADPPDLVEAAGTTADAVDAVEAGRQQEFVLALLAALPNRQRQVFGLHYEGWSTAEIAALLGMEQAAVRQNIARARRTLKESIRERLKEGSSDDRRSGARRRVRRDG